MGGRSELGVHFWQINVRGLQEEKLELIVSIAQQRNVFAVVLEETWRVEKDGINISTLKGWTFINVGPTERRCKRGSLGVGILLSPQATEAWERAGAETLNGFGERVMGVRLELMDLMGLPVRILLGAAYAPVGASEVEVRAEFRQQLARLVEEAKVDEILLIGGDLNASMGARNAANEVDRVLGPFGLSHSNNAGAELHDWCNIHEMCSTTSFFKKADYGTWLHPRSKKQHQIDYWLIKRKDQES